MKDKILMLIVGILIGAIITTGVFLVLSGNKQSGSRDEKFNRGDMGNFVPGEGGPGNSNRNTIPSGSTTDTTSQS